MTKRILRTGILMIGIALLAACTRPANAPPMPSSSSSSAAANSAPSSHPSAGKGVLQGTMTIGPVCPVERIDHPCTPTPAMYAAHPVTVYSENRANIIATLTPDAQGKFSVPLSAGIYVVDVQHQTIGAVRGVPMKVTVRSGQTVTVSIDIDTGIR